MQTLKLWLIRHGETITGDDGLYRPHHGLTEVGHAQAGEVAEAISDSPIGVCYTSELPRAIETAMHYVGTRGVELIRMVDLNEVDTGDIYSAPDSLKQRVISHDFDLDFSEFGGETNEEFFERISVGFGAMLDDICERKHTHAAAFLHGGTIGAILDLVAGQPFNYRRRPRMPNCAYTTIELALGPNESLTKWTRWESDHLTQLT